MSKQDMLIFLFTLSLSLGVMVAAELLKPQQFISPCPQAGCNVPATPTPCASPSATIAPESKEPESAQIGLASYYSTTGCIGCSESLTMANGQPLDDNKLTCAYNDAPLNTHVKITNLKTGQIVTAHVTDRGGYKRHGKIIDLSVATRDAIGCGSVCRVKVEEI